MSELMVTADAIRPYAQHRPGCERTAYESAPWEQIRCTCGEGTGSIHALDCERSVVFRATEESWWNRPRKDCTCGLSALIGDK